MKKGGDIHSSRIPRAEEYHAECSISKPKNSTRLGGNETCFHFKCGFCSFFAEFLNDVIAE